MRAKLLIAIYHTSVVIASDKLKNKKQIKIREGLEGMGW
jgi:hypothetical protein